MPAKHSGGSNRGKKLRFPQGVDVATSPVPSQQPLPARLRNMASQTEHEDGPEVSPPGISEVMAAITNCQAMVSTCQTALTSKIETVQMDVGLLRQDINKIRSWVMVAEQRVGDVEDSIADHVTSIRNQRRSHFWGQPLLI